MKANQQQIAQFWNRDSLDSNEFGTMSYATVQRALDAAVDTWLCNGEQSDGDIKSATECLDNDSDAAMWFGERIDGNSDGADIEECQPKWSKKDVIYAIEKTCKSRR